MQNLSGKSLGRYHLVEPLGRGGMAVVYKGYDATLERSVAIKVIRTEREDDDTFLLRFRREAKALAQLDHPYILKILDYGEQDGVPYLVMPFLPGGTLKDLMGAPHSYVQAAQILAPVARALAYAHRRGIVHRDVKPANILMAESGAPMLSDFGVAKLLEGTDGNQVTATGVGIGTPDYMAPEQWLGKTSPQTDIYALGIVFFELLTGRRPYSADTPAAVLLKHMYDPLPRPSDYAPMLPEAVEGIIFKALAKEPANRYTDMDQFAAALEKLVASAPADAGDVTVDTLPLPPAATAPAATASTGPSYETQATVEAAAATGSPASAAAATTADATVVSTVPPSAPPPSDIRSKPGSAQPPARKGPNLLLIGGGALLVILVVLGLLAALGVFNPQPPPVVSALEPTATAMPEPTATAVPPTPEPTATTPPVDAGMRPMICEVTDTNGIDDASFNAAAWEGAQRAVAELGFDARYLESQSQEDFEPNLNAFIDEKCSLIVTTGFMLGDATYAAAQANPQQNFAIVDFSYDQPLDNLQTMTFDTHQAAFLAGYLAAGMTKTGKVATFGGLQIPPVTDFMDGFFYGVRYYNEQHGGYVEVLGWNPFTQMGAFTGNFENYDDGKRVAQEFLDQGADVIFPVAGPVGLGAADAVQQAGGAWVIGVDSDWRETAPQFADIVLTSVKKNIDVAIFTAALQVAKSAFSGGTYIGTLENGGVGLSSLAPETPQEMHDQLAALHEQIVSGAVSARP